MSRAVDEKVRVPPRRAAAAGRKYEFVFFGSRLLRASASLEFTSSPETHRHVVSRRRNDVSFFLGVARRSGTSKESKERGSEARAFEIPEH